jgi:hypothetical protein
MAKTVSKLRTSTASGNTANKYLFITDTASNESTKIALDNVFPSLQSGITGGGVSAGSAGESPLDLFVGGGSGSAQANTSKSVLIFKGLGVEDSASNGAITVRTDTSTSDANKQNLVIKLLQNKIKLSVAENTTSKFISESTGINALNLGSSAHVGATQLAVANGGTGLGTITAGSILSGNGTLDPSLVDMGLGGKLLMGVGVGTTPTTLNAGTSGYFLMSNGAGAALTWEQVTISTATLASTLDMANNNIDLGTGVISGTGLSTKGLRLSNSTNEVFVGTMTNARFDSGFNTDTGITLGNITGSTAQAISMAACSSGSSPIFQILGSSASGTGNAGGSVRIIAGAGDTNGNGGELRLSGGAKAGSGTDGAVNLYVGTTQAVSVDENTDVNIKTGSLVIDTATEGIVHKGSLTVTQATNHSTGVTISSTSGVITLASVALAAAAEADFRVTNTTVQTDSVILLTMQSPASSTAVDNATLVAQLDEINNGSFNIRLSNPGAASTSTTAHKIHFLIINNSL